jgi:hypothetical protein
MDAKTPNELYEVNCTVITPCNTCRGDNNIKNLERIPTGHSLEKSAFFWVEVEFSLLYNKAKKCGKLKKTYFCMTDDINEEKS